MGEDTWAGPADEFVDGAYASVKGRVRTYVMHQQLLEHLPPPRRLCSTSAAARASIVSAGPSRLRRDIADPSSAMLGKARQRLERLPEGRRRSRSCRPTARTLTTRCVVGASPPCCVTACSVPDSRTPGRPAVPVRRRRWPRLDHGGQRRRDGRCARPWNGGGTTRWRHSTAGPNRGTRAADPGAHRGGAQRARAESRCGTTALVRGMAICRLARSRRRRVGPG